MLFYKTYVVYLVMTPVSLIQQIWYKIWLHVFSPKQFFVVLLQVHCHSVYVHFAVGIYSIWFYDKSDCQRIAQLMVK